jgi:hypothetical protein
MQCNKISHVRKEGNTLLVRRIRDLFSILSSNPGLTPKYIRLS